jgi:hypothetical protein
VLFRSSITGGLGSNLSKLGHSNAALFGGAALAMDGLRRGGYKGMMETAAGGALIGFKYGGPIGAAVGAIVGGIAGTIRMFIKGATEKARDKIRATYGIDVQDKGVLQQVVEIAKQSYGGNLDMAVRTQQVRDLVRLYALSTGQGTKGMPAEMTASTMVQSGGSLSQATTYSHGIAIGGSGGAIPQLAGGTNFVPRNMFAFLHRGEAVIPANKNAGGTGPITLHLQIDGQAATAVMRGEAITTISNNGRLIQRSSTNALRSNFNRREMTALQLSPGILTS